MHDLFSSMKSDIFNVEQVESYLSVGVGNTRTVREGVFHGLSSC